MTTAKWYEVFDDLLDEHLKGYYRPFEKDSYLNAALDEWLGERSARFLERTEKDLRDLSRLIREKQDTSGSGVIPLDQNVKAILLIRADFGGGYFDITNQKANTSVSLDSWHRASNLFAEYEEISDDAGTKIVIHSTDAPVGIKVKYLLEPPEVSEQNANQEWNRFFPRSVQKEIIERAITKTAVPAGDVLRLRTESPQQA